MNFGTLFLCMKETDQKKKRMDTAIKFGIGFLVGSVFGLSAGLLLAPTTGKHARKKLGKRSMRLAKTIAEYIGMEEKKATPAARATAKRRDGRAQVQV